MIDKTAYKYSEIKEYFEDFMKDNPNYLDEKVYEDLHHECFNTDYYIVGRYWAEKWLEDQVFSIINLVKHYELENFGEVSTDLAEPEQVVNMYVYIVGEHIVQDYFCNYHWRKSREIA